MPESFGAVVCIGSSYTLSSIAAKRAARRVRGLGRSVRYTDFIVVPVYCRSR